MLTKTRQKLISLLWENYIASVPPIRNIGFNKPIVLDHLAIIDLGHGYSNRIELVEIFSNLDLTLRGSGYLPDKKNDFVWMAANDCAQLKCHEAAPQVVLADFRTDKFSPAARDVIQKYAAYQRPFDREAWAELIIKENADAAAQFLFECLSARPWPLPTKEEYDLVLAENELVAWVLLFGRTVNHFGISVHLSNDSPDLLHFTTQTPLELNTHGGAIKGGASAGIEQASTMGKPRSIMLKGGAITTRDSFVELVWRHPNTKNPKLWSDYYTGFLAENANKVIESLYN